MKQMQKIINKICKEQKIKVNYLSDNWIIELEKNKKKRYIYGYKFGLNNQSSSLIADDKYGLYEVLKKNKIKVIEHRIIFKENIEKIEKYFKEFKKDVVLKINNGTCGQDVYHINNLEELKKLAEQLLKTNYSLSICPFYEIKQEYRCIILDDEYLYSYKKIAPIITGDGKSNIKELLSTFNPYYFNTNESFYNKNYSKYMVPKKGEQIVYNFKHNLSSGAIPENIEKESIKNKIIQMSFKVKDTINIRFASIDIIQTKDNKFLVLEANSGVMMENFIKQMNNGYEIAENIYKKAILKMFE